MQLVRIETCARGTGPDVRLFISYIVEANSSSLEAVEATHSLSERVDLAPKIAVEHDVVLFEWLIQPN